MPLHFVGLADKMLLKHETQSSRKSKVKLVKVPVKLYHSYYF